MTGSCCLASSGDVATVVISIAALVFSVLSFIWGIGEAKLQGSSALVNTLKQQFESPECRESRKRLAGQLLSANDDFRASGCTPAVRPRLERDSFLVLELFEQLGYLVRRKALDEGIVWSVFAWDVIRYAEALKQAVGEDSFHAARQRSGHQSLYSDFEQLATRLRAFGKREHPGRRDMFEWQDLSDFLKAECGGHSSYDDLPAGTDQGPEAAIAHPKRQS